MRTPPNPRLEKFRQVQSEIEFFGLSAAGRMDGYFLVPHRGVLIKVIASEDHGTGFEHVSVSTRKRTPTWEEMCFVKDLFFEEHETVMQLHPPKDEWISNHPHCLHLWRPTRAEIPMPPPVMVGVKGVTAAQVRRAAREGVPLDLAQFDERAQAMADDLARPIAGRQKIERACASVVLEDIESAIRGR